MRYRILIAYNGSGFVGWQIQASGISIQGTIEAALSCLLKEKIRVIGAGRTDSGVHALGQVAHFLSDADLGPYFCYKINAVLPKEIRILKVEPVPDSFHAQRSACSKIYHYHLWLDPVVDPFLAPYRYHVRGKFDVEKLKEAAPLFLGKQDFTSFANKGSSQKNAVRILSRLDVKEERGGVRLEFEGNGFLYKMVRNIVGMLLEIGKEKREISEIKPLLEAKDRRLTGPAAPPWALFLVVVHYPCDFSTNSEKDPKKAKESEVSIDRFTSS